MTYKETLFFVARALTVNHETHNFEFIKEQIDKNKVDWDKVVQVSTKHYVFPALYCNLKRANLLENVPDDLVEYMEHITNLNRERNLKILSQAKELNSLLLQNNIEPIFLKGTSFLLQELYQDIGERMVGDIDVLVPNNQFEYTIECLKEKGYSSKIPEKFLLFPSIHYPKLIHKNSFSAIEIHSKLILEPESFVFGYDELKEKCIDVNKVKTPSFSNQLLHNCINKQISDRGIYFKSISLRNTYDLYLLSQKTDVESYFERNNPFLDEFSTYLSVSKTVLHSKKINHFSSNKVRVSVKLTFLFLNYPLLASINRLIWRLYFLIKKYFFFSLKAVYKKRHREYIFYRLFTESN